MVTRTRPARKAVAKKTVKRTGEVLADQRRARTAKKSVPPVVEAPESTPEVKLGKCRDCNKPFELPRRRGRPPVRCDACREIFAAQKDTSKTTTERVAAKRSAPKKAKLNGKPARVVSEVVTENDVANFEATKLEARAMMKMLKSFGWAVSGKKKDSDLFISITATRGNENMHVEWKGGKVVHAIGGAITPKGEAESGSKSGVERSARNGVKQYRLPFEPGSASDEEIINALSNRKVTWENSISGFAESDVVRLNGSLTVALISHDGDRILNFVGANGFRSLRLSSLRRVH